MYKDIDAVADLPPVFWFQEIYEAFPDTQVILTLRDDEEIWVDLHRKSRLETSVHLSWMQCSHREISKGKCSVIGLKASVNSQTAAAETRRVRYPCNLCFACKRMLFSMLALLN